MASKKQVEAARSAARSSAPRRPRLSTMMADTPHPQAHIDWASTTVDGGTLSVELAGEPSPKWTKRLKAVVERLDRPGGGWGAIEVKRKRLTVAAVAAGAESDLHHFLAGAVQQANADFAAPARDDARFGPDEEMAAAFRAFAEPDAGGGEVDVAD